MTDISMTKSELIERIVAAQARSSSAQLNSKDVEFAVKTMLEQMSQTLASGDRIEIRGFGSFSLHYRAPRIGRNPKTGESVGLAGKHVPHFQTRQRTARSSKRSTAWFRQTDARAAPSSAESTQDPVVTRPQAARKISERTQIHRLVPGHGHGLFICRAGGQSRTSRSDIRHMANPIYPKYFLVAAGRPGDRHRARRCCTAVG